MLFRSQAAGAAPIVAARHGETAAAGGNAAADGIQIAAPARRGQILDAIEDSGGDAVAIDEATTEQQLERLHRSGFYTEPTCAVAPAALETLREAGEIGQEEDVVVPLTGSGLKT